MGYARRLGQYLVTGSAQEVLAVTVMEGAAHSISTVCNGHPHRDLSGLPLTETQDNFLYSKSFSSRMKEGPASLFQALISPSLPLCEGGVKVDRR